MKTLKPALPQIHLNPGELIFCHEPKLVVTVLGSCVAVTMFSARLDLAAICHAMLPAPRPGDTTVIGLNHYRYVSHVVTRMCDHFREAGVKTSEVEVKLFGGGNVINIDAEPWSDRWIGSANVRAARELLRGAGFSIRASNVGGNRGRKLVFNTQTGEVMHKHLSTTSNKLP